MAAGMCSVAPAGQTEPMQDQRALELEIWDESEESEDEPDDDLVPEDSEEMHLWKKKKELPEPCEILSEQYDMAPLPKNPRRRVWPSKDAYLRAQYEILRREGTEGLRFSVRDYMAQQDQGQEKRDDQLTCVYTEVHAKSYLMSRLGPILRVEFSTKRSDQRIKWQHSRRLTPGTLVAISTEKDQFRTICKIATVAERPYYGGLDKNPPQVSIMWAKPEDAICDPDTELVMIESRQGYFEAVRHTLVGLQLAADIESPLDKYISNTTREEKAPDFISQSPSIDLSSLAHLASSEASSEVPPEAEMVERLKTYDIRNELPSLEGITTLDESQIEALHRVVSKQLAIVQGPPGTGKTFTSVEAIKVMIASRRSRDPPIIVSAQTNHALDQLLNHCLDAGARILRVGGRTVHAAVKPYTMYEMRQRYRSTDAAYKLLNGQYQHNVSEVKNLVNSMFGGSLLSPPMLLKFEIINQAQYDSLVDGGMSNTTDDVADTPFGTWLGTSLVEAKALRENMLSPADEELPQDEYEFDGDLDNIADDEEDQDRIKGTEIMLAHKYSGKNDGRSGKGVKALETMLKKTKDLFAIPQRLRGPLYQLLQARLVAAVSPKVNILLAQNVELCRRLKDLKWSNDAHVVKRETIQVVGCTTTGLTKYRAFLSRLQARSLLIEEAAETREANITSALLPSVQQLILIGDHQQLTPHCDIRYLGERPYNLNVSLFERMVTVHMPYTMLRKQRRMKPELRQIVQPFYPELQDHELVLSTANRPDVPGMGGRNSWFFDHSWPEDTNADQSKFNDQEAEMIARFFAYLTQNGTPAEKITILTFYNGQRKVLLSKLRRHGALLGMSFGVHTVDSYQGEENDVVILSLVRSPQQGRQRSVGFLENRHRAVVAISRARRGFYIFGNLDNLLFVRGETCPCPVWGHVFNSFAKAERVKRASGLPLVCENHGSETWVKELDDWGDNAGGCDLQCNQARSCGHKCTLKCHPTAHERLPCSQACQDILECGHGCQRHCGQSCFCDCDDFGRHDVAQQADKMLMNHIMRAQEQMSLAQEMNAQPRNNAWQARGSASTHPALHVGEADKNTNAGRGFPPTLSSHASRSQDERSTGVAAADRREYADVVQLGDLSLRDEAVTDLISFDGEQDETPIHEIYKRTTLTTDGRRMVEGPVSILQHSAELPMATAARDWTGNDKRGKKGRGSGSCNGNGNDKGKGKVKGKGKGQAKGQAKGKAKAKGAKESQAPVPRRTLSVSSLYDGYTNEVLGIPKPARYDTAPTAVTTPTYSLLDMDDIPREVGSTEVGPEYIESMKMSPSMQLIDLSDNTAQSEQEDLLISF